MKNSIIALAALCVSGVSTSALAVDCSSLPAWTVTAAYGGSSQVKQAGNAYKANWWSQGHDPVSYSGQWQEWTLLGACDGGTSSSAPSSVASSSAPSSVAPSSKSSSSVATSSSSVTGGSCTSPQFVVGTSYSVGQLVKNAGSEYRCTIAGWCSSTAEWAYAPGTGTYWQQAWELVKSCGVTSSSSSSVVVSSSSASSVASSVTSSVSSSVSSVNNGLPKHALVGYWHNFNNGSGFLDISQVDNTWDVIVIAFADDAGNGSVAFNLDPHFSESKFIADVAAKRAAGKKVVLSFGGQNGTVTLNNATNVTNFVNSTAAIMNKYGFDGIDIDLESGAGVTLGAPIITNLPLAVKQLKAKFPNLYVSMAPEHPYVQGGFTAYGGIWGAYLPIIDALRNELSIIHVQLYNNGSLYTPQGTFAEGSQDIMVASSVMLIEGFKKQDGSNFQGLRADQVAIGVPSGSRSANTGFVSSAAISGALDCLTKLQNCGAARPATAHPTFRGMMTWSINWDVADGRAFSTPVSTKLKSLP
jgi:chitinase